MISIKISDDYWFTVGTHLLLQVTNMEIIKLMSLEAHLEERNDKQGFQKVRIVAIGSSGSTNDSQSSLKFVFAVKRIITRFCYRLFRALTTIINLTSLTWNRLY